MADYKDNELIPNTSFTGRDERALIRLMDAARSDRERTGFAWPTESAMRAVHGAISVWAPEIVIVRHGQSPSGDVLLAKYEGGAGWFDGMWHIPGGYERKPESTFEAICDETALREIKVGVIVRNVLDVHLWTTKEHPYGRPLSLYVLCDPIGEIVETDTLRWFDLRHLPTPLVGPHERFLVEHRSQFISVAA